MSTAVASEAELVDVLADQLGARALRTLERPVDSRSAHVTAVHRAASPDYHRWLNHVSSAGGCERPVRLAGHLHTINPTTGEILSSKSTETLPDGVIYVPCGDRRASVCRSCAETYRADTYQLIRAGLVGGKGVPETVATHPAVFATFTAPAFGSVHTRVIDRATGKVKPCRIRRTIEHCPHGRAMACAQRHTENSPCIGQPLCPQCYDYCCHVVWNAWVPELWRRTMITANRAIANLSKTHGVRLRLSYAKVAEYQTRGVIHFHALIRLDAIDPAGPDKILAPPLGVTAADLDRIITAATVSTTFTSPSHPRNPVGWLLAWGVQLDIRPVTFTGALTDTAVAGYLAKYASKSTEITGHSSHRITTDTIAIYANTITHTGRLIRTCWDLGHRPDEVHPADWKTVYGRLRRWAHMLGFSGHFATKSRRYSTTRAALKQTRHDWHRTHRTNHHTAETTSTIVGVLAFVGTGYRSTGDHWLALTAAARAREQRHIAKDECVCA